MTRLHFKDLTRRTASDKILCKKAFNIANNPKYDGYQRIFPLMVDTFFDKKASGGATTLTWSETLATPATQNKCAVKNKNMSNEKLAEELRKYSSIINKFKKKDLHSSFIDNIWGGRPSRYAIDKQI